MNSTSQPQREALRIAALVVLLMLPVWLIVTWTQAGNSYQKQRGQIHQILQLHVNSLDHTVRRLKAELEQLHEFMKEHESDAPEVFAASFATVASGMRADSVWVQAYQINEDGIVTHNFPAHANEASVGVNILKHPDADVSRDLQWVMENQS